MKFVSKFDKAIINDDLKKALKEAEKIVKEFLNQA
jgi:guanylate kinase